jgi:hypothetical protein
MHVRIHNKIQGITFGIQSHIARTEMTIKSFSFSNKHHSKLIHFGGRGRFGTNTRNPSIMEPEHKVETWDDLLHFSDGKERKKSHWDSAQDNLRKKLYIE